MSLNSPVDVSSQGATTESAPTPPTTETPVADLRADVERERAVLEAKAAEFEAKERRFEELEGLANLLETKPRRMVELMAEQFDLPVSFTDAPATAPTPTPRRLERVESEEGDDVVVPSSPSPSPVAAQSDDLNRKIRQLEDQQRQLLAERDRDQAEAKINQLRDTLPGGKTITFEQVQTAMMKAPGATAETVFYAELGKRSAEMLSENALGEVIMKPAMAKGGLASSNPLNEVRRKSDSMNPAKRYYSESETRDAIREKALLAGILTS